MKTKNLVSLSVTFSFLVLSLTGLLIYFGQGSHPVEHTHAWFGILFVAAAAFHIVNNWSSIKAYSRNRQTGSLRSELVIPAGLAILFAAGIATNLPGFDKLANAGKTLFQGDRPRRGGPMSPTAADSIGRQFEIVYGKAFSAYDTAALIPLTNTTAFIRTATGTLQSAITIHPAEQQTGSWTLDVSRVAPVDEHVLIVYGSMTQPVRPGKVYQYTHVLKQENDRWVIAGGQVDW